VAGSEGGREEQVVTDYKSLLCCNPVDIDTLIARVRTLLTEPSTPTTWEADHCNIISDHPRPVMLEAIKRLLGEPQPRTADPLMDAVADVVAATKPLSEVPLHEMWHARPPDHATRSDHPIEASLAPRNIGPGEIRIGERPPIERYVLATVDIPGGQVFAGLGYEVSAGDDVAEIRRRARYIIEDLGAVFSESKRSLDETSAAQLSDFIAEDFGRKFRGRPWFVEVWNEREALTQTYAPWGRPRTR
jgi:hypothetical protein